MRSKRHFIYENPQLPDMGPVEVLRPQDVEQPASRRFNPYFFSAGIQALMRDALVEKYEGVLSRRQVELVANPDDSAKVTHTAIVMHESVKHNIPYFIARVQNPHAQSEDEQWKMVGVGKVGYVSRPIYERIAHPESFSRRSHAKLSELYVPARVGASGEEQHPTIERATFHAMLKEYPDPSMSAVWHETPHDAPHMVAKIAALGFFTTGMARLNTDFGIPMKEEQFNGLTVADITDSLEQNHPWLAERRAA